ncbi:ABC transporter ATP-binding protein [Streptomyces sp. NPDC101152]|uniref:ABC transporter ATP-binding protein n=1 Tax=Streptomyces sp. NPDC101152 TaxID=3366116 RepID=UPI003822727F
MNDEGIAVTEESQQEQHVPLRRIFRLFRPYSARRVVVFGLIVMSAVMSLVSPFLLRQVMDVALPQGRTRLLAALTGGMVGLAATTTVTGVVQSYLSLSVGQAVMNDLRNAVYTHLHRRSLAFFTRTRAGEMQSRIANDIGGMAATVTTVATTIVGSIASFAGSLIAMVALDWRLTLASLLILPMFAWISRRVGDERREITLERQKQLALLSTLVEESLSVNGFLLARIMNRTETLTREFAHQSQTLTRLTVRSSMAGRWRQSAIQLVMSAMPILVYATAGFTADHGRLAISLGTLVAFTTLQQGLFGPTAQLLQVGVAVQSSLALFQRVFEYLDLPVDVPEPVRPVPLRRPRGHLRFEGVSFSYEDRPILRDIILDIPPGMHVAVVGPTGAGKTTLGYLVPRLYDATCGRITIDGTDVRDLSHATLADVVGVVSKDTHLLGPLAAQHHDLVAQKFRILCGDAAEQPGPC